MTESLVAKADEGNFDHLFRLDLFWGSPDHPPIQVELDDGDSSPRPTSRPTKAFVSGRFQRSRISRGGEAGPG